MTRRKVKDVGLRAHEVTVATTPEEIWTAFSEWVADLKCLSPHLASQRDTAKRYLAIMKKAGMADMAGAALDISRLRDAGLDEASPAWIAALWLREFAVHVAARDRGDMALAIDTAETLGRLQERMWWRASNEPVTGKTPEGLAVVGKRQTKAGQDGNRMKAVKAFSAKYGESAQARANELAANRRLTWANIKGIVAKEFSVSVETIKRNVSNPRKLGH